MEFVPGSSYNSPRTGYYNDQQEFQRKNLVNNNNYRGNNTYSRSPYSSLSNTPRVPDNNSNIYGEGIDEYHNSYENQHVAPGLIDAMSSNNPIPLHSYNLNLPNPISPIHLQILQLLLPEVDIPSLFQYNDNDFSSDQSPNRSLNYRTFTPDVSSISQLFWILSICIFLTVCDDRQSIEETLIRIEELCKFVGSGNSDLFTMSPVLGVALDVITQRVVYELSDKIAVPSINEDFSDDGVTSESTNRRNSDKDSFDTTASNTNIINDENDEGNHIEISNITNGVDYQFTGGSNFIATGSLSARSGRSTGSHSHAKKTRLEEISILRMLELFFRYMTEEFDILGSVVTLRGKGEAIPKNQWRLDPPVMWRLSIEDPFDHAVENITRPHDLGTTLTRPGQIQVFKAVRRAAYGVNAIVIKDIGETEKYVRMLFHKDDLLSLSRVSGYNGAAVITAPVYQPPSTKLSKVVVTWITELGAHFPPLLLHKPLTRTLSIRSNRLGTRQNSIRQNSPRFNQTNTFDDPSIVHIEGDYDDLSGSDDDDPLTPRVENNLGEIKKPANVPSIPLGSLKDASFNSSRSTNSILTPNILTANTNYSNYSSVSPNVNSSNYVHNKPMDIYSQQQQQQVYFNQMKSNPQSQSHNNIYLNENQSQDLHHGQRLFNPATSYNNMKSQTNRTNFQPNQRPTNLMNNGPSNGYNEFGNNDPQFNGNKNSPRLLYPANNSYDNSSNRLGSCLLSFNRSVSTAQLADW
eukprot:gene18060-23707_t